MSSHRRSLGSSFTTERSETKSSNFVDGLITLDLKYLLELPQLNRIQTWAKPAVLLIKHSNRFTCTTVKLTTN